MGSVKERYLQFEKAGDQYLGRVVSGLDVNDVSFAVSPPYFECDGDVKENILTLIKDFTVGGHGIRGEIFQMLYFCFASLCYHFDFLVQVLPQRNKLQASPFLLTFPIMQERQRLSGCLGKRQLTRRHLLECHLM